MPTSRTNTNSSLRCLLLIAGLALPSLAAGPLNPPAGPIAPVMKSLTAVEPRVTINDTNTPGNATSLYRITAAGSYVLDRSVSIRSAEHFIEVATSNVVIDLNGLRIGGQAGTLNGIQINPGVNNVIIRNGTISAFGQSGISGSSAANVTVENVTIDGVSLDGINLGASADVHDVTVTSAGRDGIVTGNSSRVRDCVVSSSGAAGFNATGATAYEGCSARENTTHGFVTWSGSSVNACIATGNKQYGVYAGNSSTGVKIEDCTVSAPNLSSAGGIILLANSTARNNTINLANTTGTCIFLVNNGNRVEGNTTSGGTRSCLAILSFKNIITGNFHTGASASAFQVAANNMLGPVVTTTGIISSTNPNANFYMP